jgi:hypothetical protein
LHCPPTVAAYILPALVNCAQLLCAQTPSRSRGIAVRVEVFPHGESNDFLTATCDAVFDLSAKRG